MESSRPTTDPKAAAAALADAEASRGALAAGLVLPLAWQGWLGLAVGAQIALTAVGLAQSRVVLVGAGAATFALAAVALLARFRVRNGVWLGGLASRVVLGTSTAASTSYALALGAAIWAAFEGAWGLVALAAAAGGAAYAVSGRRWLRAYRAQPAAHGRGEPAAVLGAVGLVAVVGMVLLVLGR